ncbi:Uma2 family endonuclease [Streptomyces gobiensis]|uniref:Uma2 family endonuclease n=1 Tax=Streptomyces gobiensis TaxID=2875706 RepID=UPI001E2DD156|nr:Uma2 family endonuclease [Streptomyces gobiensis]UGY92123.1 Uma2 family endonuclease [Streptomyces gobiensis]
MALAAPEREPNVVSEQNSAATVEDAFEALSAAAPAGWRVELIEGEIHVAPPPNGDHEEIVSEISGQVRDHRKDLGRYTNIGLDVPGASSSGKVIPDIVIAPKGSFSGRPEMYHDPAPAMLVGEVTSPTTAKNDRGKKLRGYARAGIPCYLLIDRVSGRAVLYTNPSGEHYVRSETVDLSETLKLPEPLGFELDTSEF